MGLPLDAPLSERIPILFSHPGLSRAARGFVLPFSIALLLPACSSGAATPSAAAACAKADASGAIKLTAKDIAFSAPCMEGTPSTALTIQFTNADAVPHDVAIYTNSSKSQELFRGDLVTGPDKIVTYKLPPLKAGAYFFECTVHTLMNGTFTVK